MKPLTPQEVRLGNLTSHGVVVSINRRSFYVESHTGEWYSSYECEILPVPLTPEILEGFEQFDEVDDGYFYLGIKTEIDHLSWDEKQGLVLYDNDGNGTIFKHIKHAHTLQNFVQSISGVELVYKPKMK